MSSYIKGGGEIWCEGKMVTIYDIANVHDIGIEQAFTWLHCYYLDHN